MYYGVQVFHNFACAETFYDARWGSGWPVWGRSLFSWVLVTALFVDVCWVLWWVVVDLLFRAFEGIGIGGRGGDSYRKAS